MHNYSQKIFPVIDLGDYILREKTDEDVADFFHYYTDPEVNKFILCEMPRDFEEARKELFYWRNVFYQNDGIYFAIAKKDNNQLIGSIGLTTLNSYHKRIELSYDLAKEYWRKGICSKAIAAVTKYGFEELRVNRIEAFTATQNEASKNLLLKCGFILEGLLRQHRYHRGTYVDAYSFSLLREDFYLKTSAS
ncbi:MAG: N-acetyltransferase [Proteobacteria bacterium]|nr:N-acetyltransferase [Pseudomonadota bacterium]